MRRLEALHEIDQGLGSFLERRECGRKPGLVLFAQSKEELRAAFEVRERAHEGRKELVIG